MIGQSHFGTPKHGVGHRNSIDEHIQLSGRGPYPPYEFQCLPAVRPVPSFSSLTSNINSPAKLAARAGNRLSPLTSYTLSCWYGCVPPLLRFKFPTCTIFRILIFQNKVLVPPRVDGKSIVALSVSPHEERAVLGKLKAMCSRESYPPMHIHIP